VSTAFCRMEPSYSPAGRPLEPRTVRRGVASSAGWGVGFAVRVARAVQPFPARLWGMIPLLLFQLQSP
jgi:hypothetical protein